MLRQNKSPRDYLRGFILYFSKMELLKFCTYSVLFQIYIQLPQ
nr:MAG TPA: hypothetical protein [Caudoviricetes sp.]DAH48739.1 MAG TPA: hypothetical protein [Caudoviricetes sp.]